MRAAATVVVLTNCGGSESGGGEDSARQGKPPRETRLSKAEARYVERLDAACEESEENSDRMRGEIRRLGRRLLPRAEARQVVRFARHHLTERLGPGGAKAAAVVGL